MLNYPNGVSPKDFDEKESDSCDTCNRYSLFLENGNCKHCNENLRHDAVIEIERLLERALDLQSKGCHFVAKGQVEAALKTLREVWDL